MPSTATVPISLSVSLEIRRDQSRPRIADDDLVAGHGDARAGIVPVPVHGIGLGDLGAFGKRSAQHVEPVQRPVLRQHIAEAGVGRIEREVDAAERQGDMTEMRLVDRIDDDKPFRAVIAEEGLHALRPRAGCRWSCRPAGRPDSPASRISARRGPASPSARLPCSRPPDRRRKRPRRECRCRSRVPRQACRRPQSPAGRGASAPHRLRPAHRRQPSSPIPCREARRTRDGRAPAGYGGSPARHATIRWRRRPRHSRHGRN